VLANGRCFWIWLIPALIAFALIAGRRRRPLLLLAGLLFLFASLPVLGLSVSSFQYISITADHYLYFAMFGVSLALAWLLTTQPNTILRSFTLLALLTCSILSVRQIGYWKDDWTLWPHELEVNPNSYVAFSNLGNMYSNDGNDSRAADEYARTVQLAVGPAEEGVAHDNLSKALLRAGRLDDAVTEKLRAIAVERDVPALHRSWAVLTAELGGFLCESGRYRQALPYLQTAHTIAPLDPKVTALLQRATTQTTTRP
jgi:tetratricopeptide (TPR) repeat protein